MYAAVDRKVKMPEFKLVSPFQPTGDQPQAIAQLTEGINAGYRFQTLLGATGTGKTYAIAKVIENVQKPTLVIAHNKTLAAQLYSEFKSSFPTTPSPISSAIMTLPARSPRPRHDLYRERDDQRRDRPAATAGDLNLMSRRDVIIVASVSRIYGISARLTGAR